MSTSISKPLLRSYLKDAQGNISRLAEYLGESRGATEWRVMKAGLQGFAARLREGGGVSGGRSALMKTNKQTEKRRLRVRAALRKYGSQAAAAEALGIHRRRLQREMERLGIRTQ